MIKLLYSSEKTNSFRPTPWHWSNDPFEAYRGSGARYSAFQAVAKDYKPNFDNGEPSSDGYSCPRESTDSSLSKIIVTKKGTNLLVPATEKDNEKIMLCTLRGGFRGHYSRIKTVNAEVLFDKAASKHCLETHHMVVRLTKEDGFLYAETGRRCGTGTVEIFSWNGYRTMPTDEFEAWIEAQGIDTDE